jgi:hypothetical protein
MNPYIFLPTLALSTSTFDNTLTLLSLMFASQGMSYLTTFLPIVYECPPRSNIIVTLIAGFCHTTLVVIDNYCASNAPPSPRCSVLTLSFSASSVIESTKNISTFGRVFGVFFSSNFSFDSGFWWLGLARKDVGCRVITAYLVPTHSRS